MNAKGITVIVSALLGLSLAATAQTPLNFTVTPVTLVCSTTDNACPEHEVYWTMTYDGLAQFRSGYPATQFVWVDSASGKVFVEYCNGTEIWNNGGQPQTLPDGNLLYTMSCTASPDQNSGQPQTTVQMTVQIETEPPVLQTFIVGRWRVQKLVWHVVGGSGSVAPV